MFDLKNVFAGMGDGYGGLLAIAGIVLIVNFAVKLAGQKFIRDFKRFWGWH